MDDLNGHFYLKKKIKKKVKNRVQLLRPAVYGHFW